VMEDIAFYLIHNKSKDRIYLRNRLKDLSNNLNIKLIEIYKQKKILNLNLTFRSKLVILKIYFLRIFYDFKHKKEFSFNFFYLLLKSFLDFNKVIIQLFFSHKNKNTKTYKHMKVESLVTRKHIKAWEKFLKSKKEIMVIFEDDTVCKKDTEIRLKEFFVRLKKIDLNNTFIDLAGGLNPEDIIPKRKIIEYGDEFFIVKGIYTNTACSYLINRELVTKLYDEYQKSKLNNFFPIDHLINKLGLKIIRKQKIFSIHFYNPLFTHGSFEGNIKSWQIY